MAGIPCSDGRTREHDVPILAVSRNEVLHTIIRQVITLLIWHRFDDGVRADAIHMNLPIH